MTCVHCSVLRFLLGTAERRDVLQYRLCCIAVRLTVWKCTYKCPCSTEEAIAREYVPANGHHLNFEHYEGHKIQIAKKKLQLRVLRHHRCSIVRCGQ